jgi:hypothetical protein
VLQLKKRNYARLPVFVAGAVSHSGEMAPELITFIEWVTGYRRRAAKVGGALYDGAPSAWVAEEFRTRFKAGIQTIIARSKVPQGLLGGLWHPQGSRGPSLDKAARDAVRWALNCLIYLA